MGWQSSRTLRLAVLVGAALLAVGLVRGCVLRPAAGRPGSAYNRGMNAAWLGIEWVNEPHDPRDIASLAEALRAHQIRDAYVYVSYLRSSGQFGNTYAHAAEFTQAVKATVPTLRVHAWIGIPVAPRRVALFTAPGHADLADRDVRHVIAAFAARVQQDGGFDGIHLDPEPALDGDTDLLALLADVRDAIGPAAMLSVATPRIWPLDGAVPLPPGLVAWSGAYYRRVAQRVDQVALMSYDSALPSPWLYRQWGRFQVIALSRALEGTHAEVFIGMPVSRVWTWTHHPGAESMVSGLQGAIDGLNDAASRPQTVTGVAIYPFWEATEGDWRDYRQLWLGGERLPTKHE